MFHHSIFPTLQHSFIPVLRVLDMKLMLVAGARPNFMKVASVIDAVKFRNGSIQNSKFQIQHVLVHTGQHYDESMSEAFFRDLDLPRPDIHLGVGSASHAVQTAEIMKRFEPVLLKEQPDIVMVVGDVNSTIACTLVASKVVYPAQSSALSPYNLARRPLIAHVEAGLRSFDRSMPEEINRILTDQLSDFLFVSEQSGIANLKNEGFKNFLYEEDVLEMDRGSRLIPHQLPVVAFVGNTMIDTLVRHRDKAQQSDVLIRLGLEKEERTNPTNSMNSTNPIDPSSPTNPSNRVTPFAVLTLHRPSNVDNRQAFENILEALLEVSKHIPILFPVHPRTLNRIKEFECESYFNFDLVHDNATQPPVLSPRSFDLNPLGSDPTPYTQHPVIFCLDPLGYLDFLCLMSNARLVLTDSGGIQEETTVLGIPCITLRENTERPVTHTHGTNILAGVKKEDIVRSALFVLAQSSVLYAEPFIPSPQSCSPPLWDGRAGQRIVEILAGSLIGLSPTNQAT